MRSNFGSTDLLRRLTDGRTAAGRVSPFDIESVRRLSGRFGAVGRPWRVACLVSHPIQYQAPLFRYLTADAAIDLRVLFLSDYSVRRHWDPGFGVAIEWDTALLEGYRSCVLPGAGSRERPGFWRPWVYGLSRLLRNGGFDALWIHGYAHASILRAVVLAKMYGVRVLLRGESHLGCEMPASARLRVKRALRPALFRMIDGFLTIGARNYEYYVHCGVPETRMFAMPYAVDNRFFRDGAREARGRRAALRRELGLERGRPVILFASKLEARKRAGDLLEAYARLSPDPSAEPRPYLVFVGDGEERAALEAAAGRLGWGSVKFTGFRNQSEIPRYYDLAEVFVLPSEREPWGLVVNEAMNAGKAIIVSDQVGAAADLVRDGENGFVVPVGDVATLSRRLRAITEHPEQARAMGAKSLERVRTFDFEADRVGLLAALSTVVERSVGRGRRSQATGERKGSAIAPVA